MNNSGNKGEWSELYVLVKLLADGKLYAADSNLNKIETAFSPILSVYRQESDSVRMEYRINEKKQEVELYWNGDRINAITSNRLKEYAKRLYAGIMSGKKSSFQIPDAEKIMKELRCTRIKASSTDKTDISLKIYDPKTGYNSMVGYSIKSELGNPPTLLNASGATNFQYSITGLSPDDMDRINSIDTKAKLRDRINAIKEKGQIQFTTVCNNNFSGNLLLLDSLMDDIISHMLIEYYNYGRVFCSDIATSLESKDPLGFQREGIYRYKIKKFLSAIALGMMPSKKWDGQDEANGGYIICKELGEVVTYHLYNRNSFENYLLNNTKLETGSTTKHKFGMIYKDEKGNMFINLNLQVRFV